MESSIQKHLHHIHDIYFEEEKPFYMYHTAKHVLRTMVDNWTVIQETVINVT